MRLRRIAALDGVRGLAVIAVLLYHGETRPLPGGFLGVEIFFVLTGFLVSSLLVAEHRRESSVNLPGFWRRRLERLLPELAALAAAVLLYALFFERDRVADLRWEVLSGLGFVANWHFIIASVPYFRQFDGPSLVLHLWSIGVEAQLYLVAAPLIALALQPKLRRPMTVLVIALALGSALLAAVLSFSGDQSRIYYGTDTRASGFLLGAALALLWQPSPPRGVVTRLGAALPVIGIVVAVVGLFAAFLFLDDSSPALYRGGMLGVDLLSILLIVSAAQAERSLAARALSTRPLTWLGERSYGIYLVHWPLFVILGAASWMPLSGVPLLVAESALAIAIAGLSFRYVYRPGRKWLQGLGSQSAVSFEGWRRRTAFAGGGVLVGSFLVAVAIASPPGRPSYLKVASFHGVVAASSGPAEAPAPVNTATPTASPTSTPSPTPTVAVVAPPTLAPTEAPPTPAPTEVPPPPTPIPPTPTPTEPPAALPPPAEQLHANVLAIGDSVMVGVAADGYMGLLGTVEVDAHEGRQMADFVSIIQSRAAAGTLPDVVVIQAGNNGPFQRNHLTAIMQALGESRRVIFVNVRVSQPWQDETNATVAAAGAEYPNVRVVDWYDATAGHPELFWDGIHVRPEGAQLYATLIAQALQ